MSLLNPVIRYGTADDLGYVINTWENSMRHRYLDSKRSDYGPAVRHALERWLVDSIADLYVAEQDGVILGWILWKYGDVVYCYVRRRYRRQGVATALLNYVIVDTKTIIDEIRLRYMTDTAQQLIEAGKNIRYVPYI